MTAEVSASGAGSPAPRTMRAAVMERVGAPLRVRSDIEIPAPRAGQVLVKLAFAGVCRSQIMELHGLRGEDHHLPHLLGHEGSGVVLGVGVGVTKVAAGQAVVLGWIKSSGAEVPSASYLAGREIINAGAVTTFNEFAVVSENRCVLLPEGTPLDVGALFGCALPTGAGIVCNQLRPPGGSTVAVYGLGGVGLSALISLGLFECALVIAVDTQEEKLTLAAELGATHCVNASQSDPLAEIRRLTGGAGVDFAIEAAGTVATIEMAFHSVRKNGGRCVFASHPAKDDVIRLDPHELLSGREIAGTWGGGTDPDRDIPLLAAHYQEGRLPLERLLGRRYPLEKINDAFRHLESRVALRPIIELDPLLSPEVADRDDRLAPDGKPPSEN